MTTTTTNTDRGVQQQHPWFSYATPLAAVGDAERCSLDAGEPAFKVTFIFDFV